MAEELPIKDTAPEEKNNSASDQSPPPLTITSVDGARFAEEREKIEELLQVDVGTVTKTEVSASTVVKMMGLSTSSELKLIEGKIDLLAGRMGNLSIRLERLMTLLNNTPSTNDIERLESQISGMRNMLKEMVAGNISIEAKEPKDKVEAFLAKNPVTPTASNPAPTPEEKK